jgi:non-heme chloroperoxidase
MKALFITFLAIAAVLVAGFGLAIGFGGPADPPPMPSINNPFKDVNFSDLPQLSYFTARDGTKLGFRSYPAREGSAKGSVVLVHGSSASGSSMHVMAKGFAAAGYAVYALDIRGHGASGVKGRISYVGQLENDMEDFVRSAQLARPATLIGFSSGGGFVLRVAGSPRQSLFSNYLLLSPYLSHDAPTTRPSSGGWVSVGVPRIIAISILDSMGIRLFNDLPVTKFALAPAAKEFLTPQYSFALAANFGPQRDYQANIRAVKAPVQVLTGEKDEAFYPDKFAGVFQAAGKEVPVKILPGLDHIALTLDSAAVQAAIAAVESMPAENSDPSKR